MGKNIGHIQHIKSSVVENGQPKLPVSSVLAEGELAINYAKGYETISLLNSESGITRFSSDDYYTLLKLGSGFTGENSANTVTSVIRDNELVIAAALNDLDDRKMDLSAYTPTDLSNYYTKDETSGRTEISSALGAKVNSQTFISHTADTDVHVTSEEKEEWNAKADESWVNEKLGSAFTGTNSGVTVTDYIEVNEEVIAAALNDLSQGKLDVSAYTPTDLSNYYTKDEIDDELLNYYTKEETSGATELDDAFAEKVDVSWIEEKLGSGFTGANSANTVTDVVEKNEKVIAASLNDLDERKMDATAYTPTDLSNYYTKSQTSGKTEISTALNAYADSVKYNSTSHAVEFYHGTTAGTKVFEFDASSFIIDGMVDNVEVDDVESGSSTVKCLVVSFNTDAGKQDINIPLSDIFDPNIYYTKEEIDDSDLVVSSALNDLNERKMDVTAYTPTDLSNYYTKQETSGATEISTALGAKENALAIDSTAKTSSFSAEVGKYYIVNVPNDGSVTVTLPTSNMSSTNVQSIVFLVTLGTGTASIVFTPIAFKTEGFNDMTAGNTYEVNALWNGTNWIMAMTKLEAVV